MEGCALLYTMKEEIINDKAYITNIGDNILLNKCRRFFSDGCVSYAISFFNEPKNIITKASIDDLNCFILRDFNFDCMFLPKGYENIKEAKKLLEKGLDLIELI